MPDRDNETIGAAEEPEPKDHVLRDQSAMPWKEGEILYDFICLHVP